MSSNNIQENHRFSIVACARWETLYILEWLTYHKHIGFDHVYLYCNDDDPSELYQKILPFLVGSDPFVTFHHFMFQGQQLEMYLHFLVNHRKETKWVAFLDIDEFLRLTHDGSVDSFIQSFPPSVDSIYLNWMLFGDNSFDEPPPGGVILNFTRSEGSIGSLMTKTFSRTNIFDKLSFKPGVPCHIWHYLSALTNFDRLNVVNVLGQNMKEYYFSQNDNVAKSILSDTGNQAKIMAKASVNHYIRRSKQNITVRRQRGALGDFFKDADLHGHAGESIWNSREDLELANMWRRVLSGGSERCITVAPKYPLISENKKAIQSSVSEWSKGCDVEDDASRATQGRLGRSYEFHTSDDDHPWWLVDLADMYAIREIRVFNRLDLKYRANHIKIELDKGDGEWVEIFRKVDDSEFGGVDGYPLICVFDGSYVGSRVRLSLLRKDFLHLNQVQVFGVSIA